MFYQYRKWNDNAKDLLKTNSFYYSNVTDFNDLHECIIQPEKDTKIHNHSALVFDARKNYQILCLSKAKNNSLMWAHYAESYKGVCFEFEFHKDDPHFEKFQEVQYQDSPPFISDDQLYKTANISNEMFLYKHTLWAYENEWRIFRTKNPNNKVEFHPKSLIAVHIGPAAVSKDIYEDVYEHITNYNQKNNAKVKLLRLIRQEYSYEITDQQIF